MNWDFLSPLPEKNLQYLNSYNEHALGAKIKIHLPGNFPDLEQVQIALFSVEENRQALNRSVELNFDKIRHEFYALYPGNWHVTIADLGTIKKGNSVQDTYFAVQNLIAFLLQKNIIPFLLGGSQDLMYAQYRAYDRLKSMVNLVNIDSQLDLGDAEKEITNKSYISKIIVNKPFNLFNYSNIGYQTYYNSQEEIALIDRFFFDAVRLGEAVSDISKMEPILRMADVVGIDITSIEAAFLGAASTGNPNGFTGREICALARYSGLSDKVTSFGIFETDQILTDRSAKLIAQLIWYFAEGVNYRTDENTKKAIDSFIKYQVPVEEDILVFYKSPRSLRWWIEIPYQSTEGTKLDTTTLLPCSEDDYLKACDQEIPDRWYKAKRRNEV